MVTAWLHCVIETHRATNKQHGPACPCDGSLRQTRTTFSFSLKNSNFYLIAPETVATMGPVPELEGDLMACSDDTTAQRKSPLENAMVGRVWLNLWAGIQRCTYTGRTDPRAQGQRLRNTSLWRLGAVATTCAIVCPLVMLVLHAAWKELVTPTYSGPLSGLNRSLVA
jgi:hypothetical protein